MAGISQSVGKIGPGIGNLPQDVLTVQKLLNTHIQELIPLARLQENGICDANTIKAIEEFQRRVIRIAKPDGRVDKNGRTLTELSKPPSVRNNYSLSASGGNLLKGIEQLRLKPYDDQTGKEVSSFVQGATIGYGHLISSSQWTIYSNGITTEQAEQLFRADLAPFERTVNNSIKVAISQQQYDALVILAFNIGEPNFKSSSVVKMINEPNQATSYATLDAAWKAWNKSQGKVSTGLENRRNAELNIYHRGVYQRW